jgi:DNA-binding NarL/FixJ family response regulator
VRSRAGRSGAKAIKSTRVLLADDHTLVRAGIRSLLEKMSGIEVVAEAGDGREALELIKKQLPNVVLMDIAIPKLNGLEALARATKDFSSVKVIILSMHANEEYVLRALRAGACGYLLKDAAVAELELALRAATRGETYLSPSISKRVIGSYLERLGSDRPLWDVLTPRQRETVQLIAEGKSTKEIAFLLKVTVNTVEALRAHLLERLDIHDVAGLVRYAMRAGLVPPEGQPGV